MTANNVSIVIPVYNGANFLRDAVDSALAQTWPGTEVVVVNDGSRDGGATDAIARGYGDRIRYITKANGGVASALNAGLAAMDGEVFCWLSHDDLHMPRKTEAQMDAWRRLGRPEAVSFSDYRLVDADGKALGDVRADRGLLARRPIYAVLRGMVHGCSVFAPRRLLLDAGGFDAGLPATQDYDLWFRLARASVPFHHVPEVLVLSRWHSEQGSKRGEHAAEVAALWQRMMDGVPPDEQAALEGSRRQFYLGMGAFLRRNGLDAAAAHADARAGEALADTLVSVVVPTHRRPELTAGAVESALAQTHQALEVVVVDDGSPEADLAALRRLLPPDPRLRVVRQPENRGPAVARNAGWEAARGTYVAFLDSDDRFLPEKIECQLRAMEDAGAAFSHTSYWRHFRGEARALLVPSGRLLKGPAAYPEIIRRCVVATPTVMVRRDVLDAGFAFPEDLRLGEDVVLWIRLAARYGLIGIDEPLTLVRANEASAAFAPAAQAEGLRNIAAAVDADPDLSSAHGAAVTDATAALRAAADRLAASEPP